MNARPTVERSLGFLAVLVLLASAAMSDASAGSLFPNPIFKAGLAPLDVTIGDFNNDGRKDLVVANSGSDDITLLLGVGDGTFRVKLHFDVGDAPFGVVSGDFDADGNQDLAVVNRGSNDVSVLLGHGDGTFALEGPYLVGSDPVSLVVDDFDGDGRQDLVIANASSRDLSVLLGNGDGTFAPEMRFLAGGSRPNAIASGDFNEDGSPDVVLALGFGQGLAVHLGNGDGTFSAGVRIGNRSPLAVVVADFDDDGRQDLAMEVFSRPDGTGGQVAVFPGNGDGTFAPDVRTDTAAFPFALTTGDFNGDGRPDLVTGDILDAVVGPTTERLQLSILLGNGDATFDLLAVRAPGHGLWSFGVDDLDGDGRQDLAVTNGRSNDLLVLLGNGDGTFVTEPRFAAGRAFGVAVGDFNDDGRQDLATANDSLDDVSVLLGNGDGTFAPEARFGAGTRPFGVAVGDFNADGRQDLVLANNVSDDVSVLLGAGDGTFAAEMRFAVGNSPRAVVVGDFNEDGVQDLATANGLTVDDVTVLLGNGDGSFAAAVAYGTGGAANSLAIGDFDNDGHQDLVVANSNDLLLGNGDGTFRPQPGFPVGRTVSVAVGDFDGDALQDLAVANFNSDDVSVLLGNGDGSFAPEIRFPVSIEPRSVTVADFNGDGRLDLAVTNHETAEVSVLLGSGDGTFVPDLRFGVAWNPKDIVVGDFDGNGRPDLAVAVGFDGLSVLVNQGPSANNPPVADAGADTSTECVSSAGAAATLDGSASSDPDSNLGTNDDILLFEWFEDFDSPSETLLGTGELLTVTLPLGGHEITLRATDRFGATDTDQVVKTVVDTTPPQLSLSVTPTMLWPPSHQLVGVEASVAATDTCSTPLVVLTSVTSSEPDNAPGSGDGNTTDDIQNVGPQTADFAFDLRAEREGSGNGRTYTVTYTARDGSQNATDGVGTVTVPHDLNGVADPIEVIVAQTAGGTVVSWADVPGALFYNVIRGALGHVRETGSTIRLGPVTCIESASLDTDTTSWEDPDLPDPGEIWFYLVEYNDGRPSTYGSVHASMPRVPSSGECH